jgi:RNA polymerase sigma-70 factor (ECF subfamily)
MAMTWPPELPFPVVLTHARALDQLAIGRLYRRFLPVVYRYTLGRVGDIHAAEDVTSETFMAMVEGIATTRAQDELTFAAWVLGIARNQVALHFRRAQARISTREIPDADWHPAATAEEGDPLDIVAARESWSEMVSALNQLTEDQRTVVLYRCVLGYPTEDVARLLDKQPGTIRALQFRALAALARRLEDRQSRAMPVPRGPRRRGNDATRR